MIRQPFAMGYFYPAGLEKINNLISSFNINSSEKKIDAFGVISPHAGYIYSGKTAYKGFSGIKIKDNIIIIGPNHTGLGTGFSVMSEGEYSFNDFSVSVNSELANSIIYEKDSPFVSDDLAHAREHSVEVQIPLLYSLKKDFKVVPIVVSFTSYDDVMSASKVIFNALKKLDMVDDVIIVASSDMSHYEKAETAKKKDDMAIKEILNLNPQGLYSTVMDNKISMCGIMPASIMLNIAKMAGRSNSMLIDYTNSGEVSGDYSSVVGYSSIIVY